MKKPQTSIILLCHNGWSDTRRCLEALRRHTAPGGYELLVYDNASTDGTWERLGRLARGWPELKPLRNGDNIPFAAAVNRGMRRARGEFILWLNNDTVPASGWLEGLRRVMACDPAIGAVGPMTDNMAPPAQKAPPFRTRSAAELRDTAFLGGFCFLLRKSALARTGGLDERFFWGWEDMDFCLRLRQAGYRLVLASGVFVRHAGNRSLDRMDPRRRRETDVVNRRLMLEKWLYEEPLRADLSRLFRRMGAAWRRFRPRVSIIVPLRAGAGNVRTCLDSIRRSTPPGLYEVLAVGGLQETRQAARLKGLRDPWNELRVVRVSRRLEYAHAVNRAWQTAQGEDVVLLSVDAVVSPGWLEGLLAVSRANPRAGVIGAMSNGTTLPWQHRPGPGRPTREALAKLAARLRRQDVSEPVWYLRGVCLLLKEEARRAIGELDGRFGWGHAGADYCLRAWQAGFEVRLAKSVFVYRDLGGDSEWHRDRARLLFEKWAGHPSFEPDAPAPCLKA